MKLIFAITLLMMGSGDFLKNAYSSSYSVEVFFNHSQKHSYSDPYRSIKRKGQNLEKVIIDSIRSAKKRVYIAVQELRLPLVALELIKKQREGVDVRVILENSYNNTVLNPVQSLFVKSANSDHENARRAELEALVDMNKDGRISESELLQRDAVYILKASRIKIKDDGFDGSAGSRLMHHKFIVVDDKELIVSTANFTMSGIHGDLLNKDSRGNANSLLKIRSPSLAREFLNEFYVMWGGKFGSDRPKFGSAKPYRKLFKTSIKGSKVYTQFSPTKRSLGFARSVNGTIAKFLNQAKKEVQIALFVLSDQNITNTLKRKREENKSLDINILIERKFATRFYSELLDMWGLQMRKEDCSYEYKNDPWDTPLKSAGTPNLRDGDLLHHKFAVIDSETVIVGSQNWSDSANHYNDENILVIKDKHIALKYKSEFDRLNKYAQLGPSRSLLRKIEKLDQTCSSIY